MQRRAKDRWRARYIDPEGHERNRTFTRKVDAERFLATVEAEKLRGTYIDPDLGRMAVSTYAARWFEAQALRASSRRTYDAYLRIWVLPALGNRPLAAVTKTEVMSFRRRVEAGLSPNTARHVVGLVVSIFGSAVEDGYIGRNPAAGVLPRRPPRTKVMPLPVEQVQALAAAAPDRYRVAVFLGAGCGLRIGEVLGLRVRCVRFLARELDVAEQLYLIPGAPPRMQPPKTRSSVRTVPLPDAVAEAVALHLERFPPESPDALVLRSRTGGPVWPNTFSGETWPALVARAGLPKGTVFHSLRHFYASALIRAGESVKTVQHALGHASAVETLETYAGLWPDAPERTRAAVDGLFRPRTASTRPEDQSDAR